MKGREREERGGVEGRGIGRGNKQGSHNLLF